MDFRYAEEMACGCTGGKPPQRAKKFYRHIRDSDGHPTLRYWSASDSGLMPLYSFQIFITYDLPKPEDAKLEALAYELMNKLPNSTWDPGAIHTRLDVHFLGPDASTEDCIAHYRRFKDNPPDGPLMAIVPSYVSDTFCYHHCLFFQIEDANWKDDRVGLKGVYFDAMSSDFPDVMEEDLTASEAAMLCGDVYLMPNHRGNFRDEADGAFEAAEKAGLTDWASESFAGPVNFMDTRLVDLTAPAPPRRLTSLGYHFRRLRAHDRHLILSVWACYSLPPMYSFQFYVTYDLPEADRSDLEGLARRLRESILDDSMASKPIRFDVHFIGTRATIEDCMASYRHSKDIYPDDPAAGIVASYNRDDDWSYHSHLFIISKSNWEDSVGGGMRRVSFDPVESKRVANHRPTLKRWSALHEVSGFCKDVYESVGTPARRIVEECESAYKVTEEAGLTKW